MGWVVGHVRAGGCSGQSGSVAVDIDYGSGEGAGSFLRQIVPGALDYPV